MVESWEIFAILQSLKHEQILLNQKRFQIVVWDLFNKFEMNGGILGRFGRAIVDGRGIEVFSENQVFESLRSWNNMVPPQNTEAFVLCSSSPGMLDRQHEQQVGIPNRLTFATNCFQLFEWLATWAITSWLVQDFQKLSTTTLGCSWQL